MLPTKKGVYPNWMSDNDVINQLLNDLVSNSGKVPYAFVFNDNHSPATNERLRKIIEALRKDKLLMPAYNETDDIELTIEGRVAVKMGYKKYKGKHWLRRILKK